MTRAFTSRGVSLVDVIVGVALVVVIFVGLFGVLRASIQVAGLAKLKATATEIATSQIEYVRSLAYDDVGTVGGIPAGAIPQNATTTNAGLSYGVRTYIAYIDDPADGTGAADVTTITSDYKVAKVTVRYTVQGVMREVMLVTNITPKGIETTTGGGTLQVTVVDALGAPVSGATVHIQNTSTSPAIDLSTFSDVTGVVYLPGAPTSTEYQVHVTKSGYSSAQTYARDGVNVAPNPGYLTVIAGSTTSGTFAIDRLATLSLATFSPIAPSLYVDTLDDNSGLQTLTNTVVTSGALTLSGTPGTYPGSGSAVSDPISPAYLASWTSASSTASLPLSTNVTISVGDAAGALLSDVVLPGNSSGFTGTIDLSFLSTTTYPSLTLIANLTSGDANVTPSVLDVAMGYDAGPTPLSNVSFTLTGAKTIGTDDVGASLYKTVVSSTTGASAEYTADLEWDAYSIAIPNFDIVSAEPSPPYQLLPNITLPASLILTPN